jgi:hypothetical protein
MGKDNGMGLFGYILLVLALGLMFINVPGMVLLGTLKLSILNSLDTGQLWAFSLIISSIFFITIFIIKKEIKTALILYLSICMSFVFIFLILYFGFKIDYAKKCFECFFS